VRAQATMHSSAASARTKGEMLKWCPTVTPSPGRCARHPERKAMKTQQARPHPGAGTSIANGRSSGLPSFFPVRAFPCIAQWRLNRVVGLTAAGAAPDWRRWTSRASPASRFTLRPKGGRAPFAQEADSTGNDDGLSRRPRRRQTTLRPEKTVNIFLQSIKCGIVTLHWTNRRCPVRSPCSSPAGMIAVHFIDSPRRSSTTAR
jgi:hypothetical protein